MPSNHDDASKLNLRHATARDVDSICLLEMQAHKFSHFPNISYRLRYEPDTDLTSALIHSRDYQARVMEYDGEIIGYSIIDFNGSIGNSREAKLYDMVLTERDAYLGRRLLLDAERISIARDFNSLSFEVHNEADIAQGTLYSAFGYEMKNIGMIDGKASEITKIFTKHFDGIDASLVTIRNSARHDAQAIFALEHEAPALSHFPNISYGSDYAPNIEVTSAMLSPHSPYRYKVAEYNGELIGYAAIDLEGISKDKSEAIIYDMVLRNNNPEVGRRLLHSAEQTALKAGFNRLSFQAHEDCAISMFDRFRAYNYYCKGSTRGLFSSDPSKKSLYFKKNLH